jgi:hypothetical protein
MDTRPYEIMTCVEIREILNRRASGEQELMDAILEVDASSLYYHTHSYYLAEKYHHDHHPNDFATWASQQVRDRILGERLSVLDLFSLQNVEALRVELATIIESHLDVLGYSPRALLGDPFDFVRSHAVVLPTGVTVRTAADLRGAVEKMSAESLYFHFYKDVFGAGRRIGTLVEWVGGELRDGALAERLSAVNPYKLHMERLRREVLDLLTPAGGKA